jgi:hypothetical protein
LEPVQLPAVLAVAVVVASMLSVELGIAVALFELGLGVLVGNVFGVNGDQQWLTFIAGFASIVLTFLAGAEVDPDDFRERFGITLAIGLVSFAGPFLVAWLVSWGLLDWSLKASLIAGTALSTTSLAVVYAVLVESGLNATSVGNLLMGACFVTDLATAVALSAIFIQPNLWFPVFIVVSVILMIALPKLAPWFFRRYGDRVIEPEIKLVAAHYEAEHEGGQNRVALGSVGQHHQREQADEDEPVRKPRPAGRAVGRQAGSQARTRLPARSPRRPPARGLHHAPDEHGPHLRHDFLPLRTQRRDHRPNAVPAARDRRRPVGRHTDRNRPDLVLSGSHQRPRAAETPAARRRVCLGRLSCMKVTRRLALPRLHKDS